MRRTRIALVVVMGLPGVALGATPTGTQPNYSARAELLVVVGLLLLSALVAAVAIPAHGAVAVGGKKFRTLFVGADNRWSTSKL